MSNDSCKVCDAEIKQLEKLLACWSKIDEVFNSYVNVVTNIAKNAVKDGQIHEGLELLAWRLETYSGFAAGLGSVASGAANAFMSEIENVDLNLYRGR